MADLTSGLTITNVSGAVYRTSRLALNDGNVKARELTNLLQKLISVGIYESLDEAISNRVPAGTFIIIDDPNTDIREFVIEMIPPYVVDSEELKREEAEYLKKLEAEKEAQFKADPSV